MLRIAATQGRYEEEGRRVRKDGSQFWANVVITPIYGKDGSLQSFGKVTRDITDRKQAEEALRISAHFPEENPNPVLRIARDGTILYANPVSGPFLSEWGLAAGQSLPEDWTRRIAAIVDAGNIVEQGNWDAPIESFPACCASLAEEGYVNIYGLDITDRKQAEDSLHRADIVNKSRRSWPSCSRPCRSLFLSPEILIAWGNRLANEILRIYHGNELSLSGPAETQPRHFKAVKDGRGVRLDELPVQRACRGEHVKDFEFSIVFDRGDGPPRVGLRHALVDDQGHPRGTVAVLVDITGGDWPRYRCAARYSARKPRSGPCATRARLPQPHGRRSGGPKQAEQASEKLYQEITERKRVEEALKQAKAAAKAAKEAKSRFLANISHE